MGCCEKRCLAAVALLAAAALAPASTIVDSSPSVGMLEARSARQWARLAACADEGPCQVGYSYFIDLPDTEREQRTRIRFEFFGAGFSFPLIPLGPSREQPRKVSLPQSRIDFGGAPPSFDSIPSIFRSSPVQPSAANITSGDFPGAGQQASPAAAELAMPEPASILVAAAGLGLLLVLRRRPALRS